MLEHVFYMNNCTADWKRFILPCFEHDVSFLSGLFSLFFHATTAATLWVFRKLTENLTILLTHTHTHRRQTMTGSHKNALCDHHQPRYICTSAENKEKPWKRDCLSAGLGADRLTKAALLFPLSTNFPLTAPSSLHSHVHPPTRPFHLQR